MHKKHIKNYDKDLINEVITYYNGTITEQEAIEALDNLLRCMILLLEVHQKNEDKKND
jgi:hypothetical protein